MEASRCLCTDEANERHQAVRNDRAVIDALQRLIARVHPAETANSEAIIEECRAMGKYFAWHDEWEHL